MKALIEKIKSFSLYINGRRMKEDGFNVEINPFSGRVVGKVFLSPLESYILDEITPVEESTVKINSSQL